MVTAFLAAFLTSCGTVGPEGACTEIGARVGVGLSIEAPDADRVSKATMKVCWNGACERHDLELYPSTSAAPATCSGTDPDHACGASAVQTGGKHAFADISDLPHKPVRVAVALYSESGKRLLRDQITVTPKLTYPNGKQCDRTGAPQALLVFRNGALHPR